ncbi:VCBS repeat-containing protein [Aquimarina sp. U1-2]|uniref:VCBS repeat-containing protein n=1 Tax=Aquimarina sp. U1-2 TaxID=2823141 RepID=UPI001AECF15D|nr:VCBS repeat-containing protein [Aquimarina sp. U1-2]MBP2832878.1 VCBS repeat-containing protein [Aquimarina sp. U1-2]
MRFFLLSFVIVMTSCSDSDKENKLFKIIPPDQSGIIFNNSIRETDSLNILDYDYLYNGGGVGIGDFNLDGLPDIFFSGNMKSSALYINKGDFLFEDVTNEAGVKTNRWCTGVSIVDINNDQKPDIHVTTGHNPNGEGFPNYFFINETEPGGPVKFSDKAQEMGLTSKTYAIQAAWFDYDIDGDLDLFLINNALESYQKSVPYGPKKNSEGKSTDILYRNDGLKNNLPIFTDVSQKAGITLEGWSLGIVISDFNNDNYPDVYIANDFLSNDILYINNQNGTFTDKVNQYTKHQSHNSMGVDISDINNDGASDIIALDMLPEDNLRHKTMFGDIMFHGYEEARRKGYNHQYVRNVLQVNNHDGTFSEIGNFSGISATDWSWAPLIADFDNDGLRDVYITNGYVKEITDLDFIDNYNHSNMFGTPEAKRSKLVQQLNGMKGVKKSNFFFKNLGNNQFEDQTQSSGLKTPSFSNGGAYVDLDLDGDLDLVVNNINAPALIIKNQLIENEKVDKNFFKIKFTQDRHAYGAKISIFSENKQWYAENYPQRGYLSSVDNILHFGLGEKKQIDSVIVKWIDGKKSIFKNVKINTVVEIGKNTSINIDSSSQNRQTNLFHKVSSSILPYVSQENDFDDFRKWPLHFRSYNKLGPTMAVGDVNNDQLEDVFIGGSIHKTGSFYLQTKEGSFLKHSVFDSVAASYEDTGSLLFDADNDGDLDLYCVSGGSEYYARTDKYQDRLYLNDGKANFKLAPAALPEIKTFGSTIISLDYDNDGDQDLLVGGRVIADRYPQAPRTYLLRNDQGVFKDVTKDESPELLHPGMITGAVATDLNNDQWVDLILVGEWMPVSIYYNNNGKFIKDKTTNGLQNLNGWWNCIEKTDFDNDGDIDFVIGNWGLNNSFKASLEQPLSLYAKDYDNNGAIESIFTKYVQGEEYIVHPRNTLTKQLPFLRNVLKDYKTYGETPFKNIFGSELLQDALILKTYELASIVVENHHDGTFTYKKLPPESQWFPVFDFLIEDVDQNGLQDIIAVGNYHGTEVLNGRYDAGNGIVLLNKGDIAFETKLSKDTGFKVPGEGRCIAKLKQSNGLELIVTGVQNDSLQIWSLNKTITPSK